MSVKEFKKYFVASSLLWSTSFGCLADGNTNPSAGVDVNSTIQSISKALKEEYIFPDVASEISKVLEKNEESGVYTKYQNPHDLSAKLTEDIRSINKDVHLSVVYTPQKGGGMRMVMRGGTGSGANSKYLKALARKNYGFKSVEIMEGNVGYINLTSFVSPTYAGETAAAAMQYLYNTDAIIFDLRENRGGAGEMYQLLASYLFDQGPLKLNEIYWPSEDRRYQVWTLPHLPNKRMPNKDIYILNSSITASAAEVFSYTLKHHNRAKIVGEITVGAANPISPTKVSKDFTVWMSKGEATHPITKSNWEGKGVIPHVQTTRQNALNTAHMMALENLSEKNKDDSAYFEWFQEIVKAKGTSLKLSSKLLRSYEGTFNSRSGDKRVTKVNDGELWYGPNTEELTKLVALTNTSFMLPGDNSFKLQITMEGSEVTGINRLFSSGRVIPMKKQAN